MANTVDRVANGLVGLKTARTKAGLTQRELAEMIGTDRANIAGMESAARSMSVKMAERLAERVDAGSAKLVIANRLAAMKTAKKENDAASVLLAAKGILEIAGDKDLTPEGEAFLDAVADEALEFAGVGPVSKSASPDQEVYGYEETRDPAGRRVSNAKAAESRQTGIWPSMGGGSVLPDPEDYDPIGHDGRDINGHRIAPLPDEDDFGNEE